MPSPIEEAVIAALHEMEQQAKDYRHISGTPECPDGGIKANGIDLARSILERELAERKVTFRVVFDPENWVGIVGGSKNA